MPALQCSNRISACRRGLNSHEAILPRLLVCRRRCAGKPAAEPRIQRIQVQAPCRTPTATKDKFPRQVGAWFRVGSKGPNSVLGAATVMVRIGRRRRGGHIQPLVGVPSFNLLGASTAAAQAKLLGCHRIPLQFSGKPSAPNPSLNRTSYGRPPWPELRYAVHSLSSGQSVLPPLAG